jgi:hypothetical protein
VIPAGAIDPSIGELRVVAAIAPERWRFTDH